MKNTQNTQNQPVTEFNSSNGSGINADYQVVTAKTIKKLLVNDRDKLAVKIKNLKYSYLEERIFCIDLMVIQLGGKTRKYYNLYEYNNFYSVGMSIEKFGSKIMYLQNYDLLGNKTTAQIKYSDLTIIENYKQESLTK